MFQWLSPPVTAIHLWLMAAAGITCVRLVSVQIQFPATPVHNLLSLQLFPNDPANPDVQKD